MTHWNYRVILTPNAPEDHFGAAVHEVHYDEIGLPVAYAVDPVKVETETVEGLKWMVEEFIKALAKPVLTKDDFPKS